MYVNHANTHTYVYFQRNLVSNEIYLSKHAFEAYAKTFEVQIQYYLCDNERFANDILKRDSNDKGQTILYIRVNTHFQNRIAEIHI